MASQGDESKRALVVLGMHRSGTSAVARMLMLLGADAPKRLMPPDSSNERGHWEPVWMTTLHDEIFRSVSSRWDDVEHLPATWFDSSSARRYERRAVELLGEDYGDSDLFVVKDPRMSRTVPFWRSVFDQFGTEASYVIVVRNPMEIARSLKARDGMTPGRSLLLFLRDTLAVEYETRGRPRVFVSFEQTLSDWRSVAGRISEQLGVVWPNTTQRSAVEIERFLSPKHRHHVATGEDLPARPEVVDWVKAAHAILEEAAETGSEPDLEGLDAIRTLDQEANLAYGPVLAEAELDAESKGMKLHDASAQSKRLSMELEIQRRSAEGLRDWVTHLESSRSWRITRPLRGGAALVRRMLRRPVHQPEPPPASTAAPAPRRNVPSTASEESLAAWIQHLENSRSWRITRPLRAAGALVRRLLRRPVSQPEPPRVSSASPVMGTGAKAASASPYSPPQTALQPIGASEQSMIAWIQHVEGSRSWRITRPLRSLGALARRLRRRPVRQPEPPAVSKAAAPGALGAPPPPRAGTAPAAWGVQPEGTLLDPARQATPSFRSRAITGWPAQAPDSPLWLPKFAPAAPEPMVQGNADQLVAQIDASTSPADSFEEFDPAIAAGHDPLAKLIAFYLPQFHSIPENDDWWGKGFTDWRNVVRGTPRFAGHYQPRIPRDLGFYDLSDPDVLRRQVDLARGAGLHGFAFYYFSFSGRRLLERPLERFLGDRSIDFKFCVTWANENWTRRWDGLDGDTLIRQRHDPAQDAGLVDDLQRHFEDPRYIRIQGRPLFLIYRFDVLADARETVARWRELWQERHGEDPLIFLVQSFEDDPRPYGADGAVEFPPQRLARWDNTISDEMHFFDPEFAGYVIDYESVVNTALQKEAPPYEWARGVNPSWDNDARRQGAGTILHGSTPELYERWLASIVSAARENPVLGEPLVFVNAWNEWAEGAYLEPDVHYGAAYLNATARAACRDQAPALPSEPLPVEVAEPEKTKVLLVGHDAHPHGAQMNLRALGDRLSNQFGCEVAYLLFEGGPLTVDYREQGETHVCGSPELIGPVARQLRKRGYGHAIVNTLAAADALTPLKEAGFRVVSLVNELPGMIRTKGLEGATEIVARHSNTIVFPATVVAEAFSQFAELPPDRSAILPQGLFRERRIPSESALAELREELAIPSDAKVVLNVGYADQRKGIDLFLESARLAAADAPDLHFVWLGNLNADALELRAQLERSGAENVHFAPFTEDTSPYLELADVFFLSSREDPFPSVVLEALDAGLPVVGFRESAGTESLVAEHGALVDPEDVPGSLEALRRCAVEQDPGSAEARRRAVRDRHQYDAWAFDLLRLLDEGLQRVSVVVPNYNYAEHLAERLDSIFSQTYPIFELIVLDDGSTDSSILRLEEIAKRTGRRFRVVANAENSGSVFEQWRQAGEQVRGDYLWIAEADDRCRPEFLERLMRKMQEGVAFAFSDSAQIDGAGTQLADSYQDYYTQSANGIMRADFVLDGDQFVRSCLVERNLILNASSVVWNLDCLRETLDRCFDDLLGYRLAGDWYLYAAGALSGRRVAYVSDPLSIHRRHENGVTSSLDKQQHLEEVRRVHAKLADWLSADEDERARMETYEAELEKQFGITP